MKNFELRDSEGNVIHKLPENARILEVRVSSSAGEKALIRVGDVEWLSFEFVTTGNLVPNLLDEEDARVEQQRRYAEANSPEAPSDDEEAQKREGTRSSFDFVLTNDQSDVKSPSDYMDAISPAGPDASTSDDGAGSNSDFTGPNSETTGDGDRDSNGNKDTTDDDTNDGTETTPNPLDTRDNPPNQKNNAGDDSDKGNSSSAGLNL